MTTQTVSEPRTEAGRRLLNVIAPGRTDGWLAEDILAIEAQARAPYEAVVEALERMVNHHQNAMGHGTTCGALYKAREALHRLREQTTP